MNKSDGSPHRCNAPYIMSPREFGAQRHIKTRLKLLAAQNCGGRTVSVAALGMLSQLDAAAVVAIAFFAKKP